MQLDDANPVAIQSKEHLLNLIHVLLAHEADAAEEYNNVITATGSLPVQVKTMLEEVRKDERNHIGKLLQCIEILDKQEASEIASEE